MNKPIIYFYRDYFYGIKFKQVIERYCSNSIPTIEGANWVNFYYNYATKPNY